MSRHIHARLGSNSILTPPQARHRLRLSVERQCRFAIERIDPAAGYALLIPGERMRGKRHGYRHVDANLAGLDLALETACGGAAAREDCDAVAVLVVVDQLDGFVDGVDVQTHEDGTEDLFFVAPHVRLDVGD